MPYCRENNQKEFTVDLIWIILGTVVVIAGALFAARPAKDGHHIDHDPYCPCPDCTATLTRTTKRNR